MKCGEVEKGSNSFAYICAEIRAYLGQQRVLVLDAVRLVDDDVAPVELFEVVLLLDDHLVRGYARVPFERRQQHVRPLLRLS